MYQIFLDFSNAFFVFLCFIVVFFIGAWVVHFLSGAMPKKRGQRPKEEAKSHISTLICGFFVCQMLKSVKI